MSNSLDGYAVFITGGSSGLGLSHARVLAGRGAKVAITDFKQENLDRASAELRQDGVEAFCLLADNRVVAEIKNAVAAAEAEFGKLDVLVNNAGITGMMKPIEDIDEAFFDSLFDTHVKGAFFAVQAVVPGMKKRKFGRIINTGSPFAMIGAHAMSHYTGAKGALAALTRAWAREFAHYRQYGVSRLHRHADDPQRCHARNIQGDCRGHGAETASAAGGGFLRRCLACQPRNRCAYRAEHQPQWRSGDRRNLTKLRPRADQ